MFTIRDLIDVSTVFLIFNIILIGNLYKII